VVQMRNIVRTYSIDQAGLRTVSVEAHRARFDILLQRQGGNAEKYL
jgi:hypothetical protein